MFQRSFSPSLQAMSMQRSGRSVNEATPSPSISSGAMPVSFNSSWNACAISSDVVRDVRKAMERKQVNQALLARRIRTSRSAVARLLKAEDRSMTLRLLGRIAVALGARVNLQLAGRRPVRRRKLDA